MGRDSTGKQPSQISHGEHSVGEHIVHAGLAGEIEIYVNGIMITGSAGKQGQRETRNRLSRQPRNFISNLQTVEADLRHQVASPFLSTIRLRSSATSEPLLSFTTVSSAMNSSIPPFLS